MTDVGGSTVKTTDKKLSKVKFNFYVNRNMATGIFLVK